MSVDRVAELVRFCGIDSMLLIGGSLLRAGAALPERTRDFVQAVAAAAAPGAAALSTKPVRPFTAGTDYRWQDVELLRYKTDAASPFKASRGRCCSGIRRSPRNCAISR